MKVNFMMADDSVCSRVGRRDGRFVCTVGDDSFEDCAVGGGDVVEVVGYEMDFFGL